jgi:hypothetical protein
MFNLRKIVSLTALLTFIIVVYTGVMLFFAPEGRVAYWVNWQMLGLSKTQYSEVHTVVCFLFLIVSVLHIYLNWKSIVYYLKNKMKKTVIFTPNFIVSLCITFVFLLGSLYKFVPFETFLNIGTDAKEYWAKLYGEPPFGHAELVGLKSFCGKMNIDYTKAIKLLEENGITVKKENETLLDIAVRADKAPAEIYNIIRSAKKDVSSENSVFFVPSGFGKKTLERVCIENSINLEEAVEILKQKGFEVTPDMPIKDIAAQKGVLPTDIYEYIRR